MLHEDITYDEVYNTMDNLWDFIFFTGYFKKISEQMDEEDNKFTELAIPNKEVKYIFRSKILKWFNEKIKAENLSELYKAIVNEDVRVFQKEINRLLRKTILVHTEMKPNSLCSLGKFSEPNQRFGTPLKNFYHGFVAGILSYMDGYYNREGGN